MGNARRMGNEIERATTAFNAVVVRSTGDRVDLEVEGATFATWHPRHLLTGYSWDALSAGCLLRAAGPPASVLVLGLGGGTVVRQLRRLLGPAVRIVGVEIDPGVVDLATKHLHLGALDVEAVVADAYAYLASTTDRFDAVVDDLYLTGPDDVMRSRAPAGDTLELIRARLAPAGVLVANLITDEGGHRHVQRTTRKAFSEAFAAVRIVKPPRGLNEILVGGDVVSAKAALAPYRARFDDDHDKKRWDELTVRALR
jgi:predicted membrane-bound spermidine synthase